MLRNDYLERILKARVYDVAMESPLELAPALSKRLKNRLYLKREDLQPVWRFFLVLWLLVVVVSGLWTVL